MPKLLVFQHVPFEILGTLNPLLRSYGFRIRYVNFGRHPDAEPSLEGYDGLVVLGGPMSADDDRGHPHLPTEARAIADAIERDMPVLGICLGAQLIARTLGATVGPNPSKEIGWYPVTPSAAAAEDPLFGHFRPNETLFQWHADTFELPPGALHLASSPACQNQAFRYGDRVYGLQFHMEVDAALIERWLTTPVHQRELSELQGRIDPETIRRETPQHLGRLRELADQSFSAFAALFGPLRRRDPNTHPHHR